MNILLRFLIENNISQRRFAETLCVSPQAINMIIHEKMRPSLKLARKIEILTGIPSELFLKIENHKVSQ